MRIHRNIIYKDTLIRKGGRRSWRDSSSGRRGQWSSGKCSHLQYTTTQRWESADSSPEGAPPKQGNGRREQVRKCLSVNTYTPELCTGLAPSLFTTFEEVGEAIQISYSSRGCTRVRL